MLDCIQKVEVLVELLICDHATRSLRRHVFKEMNSCLYSSITKLFWSKDVPLFSIFNIFVVYFVDVFRIEASLV